MLSSWQSYSRNTGEAHQVILQVVRTKHLRDLQPYILIQNRNMKLPFSVLGFWDEHTVAHDISPGFIGDYQVLGLQAKNGNFSCCGSDISVDTHM